MDVAPETATLPPQSTPPDQPTAEFSAGSNLGIHSDPTLPFSSGSAVQSAKFPAIPGYELIDVLGRGGMGVVYKARQQSLNRIVALKMILAGGHATPAELARFRAEAEAVANLQHPNIVQIYDINQVEGSPYFSLEFVEGGSLAQRIADFRLPIFDSKSGSEESGRTWPREQIENRQSKIANLVETLARAMHYAHQRGIIHRDLKPANVQITLDGTPKITDFGLAKRLDLKTGHTQTGAIMGTPGYMSPEQASGKNKEIGPPSDIHALGVILYELLTGRPPFTGDTPIHVAMRVAQEDPPPPSRFQPRTPRDLETICMKCLEKDPRKRYPSAEALADDLRRFQRNEPITARPSGILERTVRAVKRRKEVALVLSGAAATIVILALLAGLGEKDQPASPLEPDAASTSKPSVAEKLEPLPPDLALVPRDAVGFLSVRVADLWQTEGVRRLQQWINKEFATLLPGAGNLDKTFEGNLGVRPADIERATIVALAPDAALLLAPDNSLLPGSKLLTIFALKRDADRQALLKALVRSETQEHQYRGRTFHVSPTPEEDAAVCFVNDRTVLVGYPEATLRMFLDRVPAADSRGPLRNALGLAAQEHHAVLGLNPAPMNVKPLAAQVPPEMKVLQPLGEIESAALLVNLRSTARTREFGDMLQMDFRLLFPDGVSAKSGKEAAAAGVAQLRRSIEDSLEKQFKLKDLERLVEKGDKRVGMGVVNYTKLLGEVLDEFALALDGAQIEQKDKVVHVLLNVRTDLPTLSGFRLLKESGGVETMLKAVGKHARKLPEARTQRLSELFLAFERYRAKEGRYPPPAILGRNGTRLLSWRVAILPYLDDSEAKSLYAEFRLYEPWNSQHNRKLLSRMPKIYAPESDGGIEKPGSLAQAYLSAALTAVGAAQGKPALNKGSIDLLAASAVVGDAALPKMKSALEANGQTPFQLILGPDAVYDVNRSPTPAEITDDPRHTILVVEAAEAVSWSRPQDLQFHAGQPLPKLGSEFGFNALFCDGSARYVNKEIGDKAIRALITRAGGEKVEREPSKP